MKRNPLYSFRNRETVGIFDVPLHSTVHILDSGDSLPKFVELISKEGMHSGFTIGNFLDNPNLYIDLSKSDTSVSELERVQGDSNEGWALFGRVVTNYGEIGQHAVDLSENNLPSTTSGATGNNSIATGTNTSARASNSSAHGLGTVSSGDNETVLGQYNDTSVSSGTFVVGIGTNDLIRKDAFRVTNIGEVLAPELTIAQQESGNAKILVTKEYADIIDGGNL